MEKVYISYFYQIRFMTPEYVPISTALSDPKWFHNFNGNEFVFFDKNGVINGIRSKLLKPGLKCQDLCTGSKACALIPSFCRFLQAYREQLSEIDFNEFKSGLAECLIEYSKISGVKDPIPVFIVYEAPSNSCSERVPLIEWFNSNSIECEEWSK